MICPNCKSEEIRFVETPYLTHYGKEECAKCGRWIRWIQRPENEGIRTKTSKYTIQQVLTFHKKEREICFFCLRERENLGLCETLTIDHIEELDKNGKDELENLQLLCSACHKLKNWARLYMNWHLKKE